MKVSSTKLKYITFNSRPYESHLLVLSQIAPDSRVLDIGCATGYFAKELQKKNCMVWGIEMNPIAANKARKYLEDIFINDVKDIDKLNLKKHFFDYILLLDVIEHISEIDPIIDALKKYLSKNGRLIISTPNIAHISVRLGLFKGQFNYTQTGILDRTHVHFYTRQTLLELLKKHRYGVELLDYSADFGTIPKMGRFLRHVPKIIQFYITKLFPTLLAVQYIVVCSAK